MAPTRVHPSTHLRSFGASELVALPHIDAKSALRLGELLEEIYRDTDAAILGIPIHVSARRLFEAREVLRVAVVAREDSGRSSPIDPRKLDRDLSASLACLFELLGLYARLPPTEESRALGGTAAELRARRAALKGFLDGLRWYVLQISASVDESAAGSAEVAEKLLHPVAQWPLAETSE